MMPNSVIAGINSLPDELVLYLFKQLSFEDVLNCENVCQRWRKLSHDYVLWKNILVVYCGKAGQTEISKKHLELITSHGQYISRIKIQYIYDYSLIMSLLHQCTNINSLELVMCRISAEFAKDIKMFPDLRKLNLKNSILFKEMLIDFEDFQYISHIELADFGLSSANCFSLLHCVHLCHIFIEKIKSLALDDVKTLILAKQNILKSFHIYGGDSIDNICLKLLAECNKLKDLAIIRCENLTDEGILSIGNLKLKHLQIWNNRHFSEIGLLHTLSNPNLFALNNLSLSRIDNISPIIVDVISENYKCLKFLALYQCPKIVNTDYEKQLKSKFRNLDVVLY